MGRHHLKNSESCHGADRARQDASNGGLCSPNGLSELEIAPVIGDDYRFLIDLLISIYRYLTVLSWIDRACQDPSNGGLWSPNGLPELEIALVIGNDY